MKEPHMPTNQGPNIETLLHRQEFFKLVLNSHLRWMRKTKDPVMISIHRDLVHSLENIIEQYAVLLNQHRDQRGI